MDVLGLWWPAADEDGVRAAASAWDRMVTGLERAVDAGRAGVAQADARWTGDAADRFEQAWREQEQALRADAAACRAMADGLRRYADAVAAARSRVEEIAVTAGASLVVGVGLAWLSFGASAAVAVEVSAGLVAAAAAIGVELSATAAAIGAGVVTAAVFGAAEAAVVDMAVTQPLRVEVFDDGSYSGAELAGSAASGAAGGGAIGGALAASAVRPMARIAAGDLSGVRAPGGAMRAALDPSDWGPQGPRFSPGVHDPEGLLLPHEKRLAEFLADEEGSSVHAHRRAVMNDEKSPDVLVRRGGRDPGTYIELKELRSASSVSVMRNMREAESQLGPWGGGEAVIDGRRAGLTSDTAEAGVDRATKSAQKGGKPLPEYVRLLVEDGTSLTFHRPGR